MHSGAVLFVRCLGAVKGTVGHLKGGHELALGEVLPILVRGGALPVHHLVQKELLLGPLHHPLLLHGPVARGED
eukprot:1625642-Pyramimonas_sp.AAC.1